MSRRYVSTKNQSYDEWLRERGNYIGGSGAAAALGLNPWMTPYQYWKRIVHGEQQAQQELMNSGRRDIIEFGIAIEDYIAQKYAHETGFKLQRDNKTWFHRDWDFLGANIDRRILGNAAYNTPGIFEAKSTGAMQFRTWKNQVPVYYRIQVLHYMNVLEYEWSVLSAFIAERRSAVTFGIQRNDKLIKKIESRLVKFWKNYVETKQPPPPVNERDLLELFPVADPGKSLRASVEIAEKAKRYYLKRQERLALEKEESALKEEIELFMKDAATLISTDDKVIGTFNTSEKQFFNQSEFKKTHIPEIVNRYMGNRTERRLTIKKSINDVEDLSNGE